MLCTLSSSLTLLDMCSVSSACVAYLSMLYRNISCSLASIGSPFGMSESPNRPTNAPGGKGPGSSANLNGLRSSSNRNGLPWLWFRWVVLLLLLLLLLMLMMLLLMMLLFVVVVVVVVVGGEPLASSPPPATNQHGYCNCSRAFFGDRIWVWGWDCRGYEILGVKKIKNNKKKLNLDQSQPSAAAYRVRPPRMKQTHARASKGVVCF